MLAKSKLNSIETLMSQALVDLNISHEKTVEIIRKIAKMYGIKNFFFFFCIYKVVDINVENYQNA